MLNDASCFKQVYIVTGYTDLRSEIDQLFLSKQDQFESIDSKLQLVLEQLAVANSKRFGRSSEKMAPDNQIAFMEVDGKLVFFNEAEAVAAITEI